MGEKAWSPVLSGVGFLPSLLRLSLFFFLLGEGSS